MHDWQSGGEAIAEWNHELGATLTIFPMLRVYVGLLYASFHEAHTVLPIDQNPIPSRVSFPRISCVLSLVTHAHRARISAKW